MSGHLDLLRLRCKQATVERVQAELALGEVMRSIEPSFSGSVSEALLTRRWESRVEHPNAANSPLALAWSAFAKARRLESRARRAALLARSEPGPAFVPSIGTAALTPAEVIEGIRELRAAA
jgi:hypothetical protein